MDNEKVKKLTPSAYFKKEIGLQTREAAELIGMSYRTLEDWYNKENRKRMVELMIMGLKYEKTKNKYEQSKLEYEKLNYPVNA